MLVDGFAIRVSRQPVAKELNEVGPPAKELNEVGPEHISATATLKHAQTIIFGAQKGPPIQARHAAKDRQRINIPVRDYG